MLHRFGIAFIDALSSGQALSHPEEMKRRVWLCSLAAFGEEERREGAALYSIDGIITFQALLTRKLLNPFKWIEFLVALFTQFILIPLAEAPLRVLELPLRLVHFLEATDGVISDINNALPEVKEGVQRLDRAVNDSTVLSIFSVSSSVTEIKKVIGSANKALTDLSNLPSISPPTLITSTATLLAFIAAVGRFLLYSAVSTVFFVLNCVLSPINAVFLPIKRYLQHHSAWKKGLFWGIALLLTGIFAGALCGALGWFVLPAVPFIQPLFSTVAPFVAWTLSHLGMLMAQVAGVVLMGWISFALSHRVLSGELFDHFTVIASEAFAPLRWSEIESTAAEKVVLKHIQCEAPDNNQKECSAAFSSVLHNTPLHSDMITPIETKKF